MKLHLFFPPFFVKVIMSNLNNPRGLAFDHRGSLLVAEAGRGLGRLATDSDTFHFDAESNSKSFYGATGSVSRLTKKGVQERIITGLPSTALNGSLSATGPVVCCPISEQQVITIPENIFRNL